MDKKLIVLKVGTSSLTDRDGTINKEKIRGICQGAADLRDGGYPVIIVSSGSIAAGFSRLGYAKRPTALSAKQACAAVGQGLLMREYEEMLYANGYACAQILLTPDTFTDKDKYKNAFSTLETLLSRGAVPIINENDTVATEQIRFGDNDTLSARVAAMMHAGRLVLLTDVDGLYTANPAVDPKARLIPRVDEMTSEIEAYAQGAGSANGTGGMTTKLSAARLATASGVEVFITRYDGRASVANSVKDDAVGTLFTASGNLKTKEQWMTFYAVPEGKLTVDDGAVKALRSHKSLLRAGITAVSGSFGAGAVVDIIGEDGKRVARGSVGLSASELRTPHEGKDPRPAVHADNIVLM